jgi:hypothetical protein
MWAAVCWQPSTPLAAHGPMMAANIDPMRVYGTCVGLGGPTMLSNMWQSMVIGEILAIWHPWGIQYAANQSSLWHPMVACWQATPASKGFVGLVWRLNAPIMLSNMWQNMVSDEM